MIPIAVEREACVPFAEVLDSVYEHKRTGLEGEDTLPGTTGQQTPIRSDVQVAQGIVDGLRTGRRFQGVAIDCKQAEGCEGAALKGAEVEIPTPRKEERASALFVFEVPLPDQT